MPYFIKGLRYVSFHLCVLRLLWQDTSSGDISEYCCKAYILSYALFPLYISVFDIILL